MSPVPTSAERALRNPIGTHLKVGKGLVAGALSDAQRIGAEAMQIFAGNPRGWANSAGKPEQDRAFRDACHEAGIRVFIHAPYLVNLGSPTAATYDRSVASVAHNLKRAVEIGAEGVVVHTGSCVTDGSTAQAMRQVRDGLLPILDAIGGSTGDRGPWLLLEPTAGQGQSLCAGVDDLEAYLDALDLHPRAGICLDTCHVFAAGAALDEPGGTTDVVDRIVEIGGPGRLRLVHANDSMDVRGAFKDRHQKIGQGYIGTTAFEELFAHDATDGVPFILETPGSRDEDDPDIPLLKKLRDA
ncbi:MAG TPA: deoxyribonuclease IV [Nocardioidaceae bacterium]|nr:deoxyribonuclease IV [Nocardioidaceae bacterium]